MAEGLKDRHGKDALVYLGGDIEKGYKMVEYSGARYLILDDQIIRNGQVVTLTSATHHQRHAPCIVLIQTDKNDIPFRVTVTPLNHEFLPRRDILPFDMVVDFGVAYDIKSEDDRPQMKNAFSYSNFLELFDIWVDKCHLGHSSIGEERKFLPIFLNIEQFCLAKDVVWSHGILEDWTSKPYRILESIIAHTNDRVYMKGDLPKMGKNTYSQFSAKMGFRIPASAKGPLRLDYVARAYHKLISF